MNAALLIELTIALLGLWVSVAYLWSEYRLDRFRDELFRLRDELFDIAARGEIAFNNPAYTMLRVLLNGMIRYAHRMNLITLVASRITQAPDSRPLRSWKNAMKSLPPTTQDKLNAIHRRLFVTYSTYLITGSLFLLTLSAIFAIWYVLARTGRRSLRVAGRRVAQVMRFSTLEKQTYCTAEAESRLCPA